MNKTIIILLLFTGLIFAQEHSPKTKNNLWEKAVRIAEQNRSWMPQELTVDMFTNNSKGKLEETSKSVIGFSINNGEVTPALISTKENGINTTEKNKKTFSEDLNDYMPAYFGFDPFAEEYEKIIKVKASGKTNTIDKITCSGYDFNAVKDEEKIKGIAWLHSKEGHAIMIEYFLPDTKEDRVKISNIHSKTRFTKTAQGAWYATFETTTMNLKASAIGFLNWKGTTTIETKFCNYVEVN
jgi:hypothetical protein